MKNKTVKGICCWAMVSLSGLAASAQNPILRSATAGDPAWPGVTPSILVQKGDLLGIGTSAPSERLTIRSYQSIPRGPGEVAQTVAPAIRFEHEHAAGWRYWHLVGGNTFTLANPLNNTVPFSVLQSGEIHLMDKLNLNVQGLTGTNDSRLGCSVDPAVRRIFWTAYTPAGGNNTAVPLEFLYDAQGPGSVDVSVMRLMPSGQVRIGNPHALYQNFVPGSPAAGNGSIRLTVDGNVAARGYIATQQSWADHVFYAPGNNPTLAEEAASIQTRCTLVGVPDEREAAAGRNLAENDALILQKLEQLYLHVIELNARLEALIREHDGMKVFLNLK